LGDSHKNQLLNDCNIGRVWLQPAQRIAPSVTHL
jgi:hypothetical protein